MKIHSLPRLRASVSLVVAVAALVVAVLCASPTAEAAQAKKVNRYIGAQKCKLCHASKETGNQFDALSHMKHSHAFESLATDAAKKIAKEKGIADAQKADACVKCHMTAFGVPDAEIAKGFDKQAGVQCESCHGPGDLHVKARMAAAATEDANATKVYKGLPDGEIVVNPPATTCTACHNKESPSYKPFCYCKRRAEIRHLNPKRERTDAEKAALVACTDGDDCPCKTDCCKGGTCTELAKPAK
jgi:hypothetical protein